MTELSNKGAQYPVDIDCVWIARDGLDQVAAFVTAGSGPIPEQFFSHGMIKIEEIEDQIVGLPEVSQASLFTSVPRPDDFLALARRGFYVFDWTDVHRTAQQSIGAYELVASPSMPRTIDTLPNDLRAIADDTTPQATDFSVCKRIDPNLYAPCKSSPDQGL